jgi:hypothetical protein
LQGRKAGAYAVLTCFTLPFNIRGFFIFCNMKVYKTNSGLAYSDYAYFVKAGRKNNYICIGLSFGCNTDVYEIGDIEIFNDEEVSESHFNTSDFAICKTYLFRFWAKQIS